MLGFSHVPGRRAIVGLGGVVPSLAVAAHEEHLEVDALVLAALVVQRLDIVGEALPLGLLVVRVELGITGVGPVDETKVPVGLWHVSFKCFKEPRNSAYIVKGAGVRLGIILEEEARNRSVRDIVAAGNFLPGNGAGGERQDNGQQGGLHLDARFPEIFFFLAATENRRTWRNKSSTASRRGGQLMYRVGEVALATRCEMQP